MKYKKILLILIVYLLLCNFDVFAKDVQVFFITEGGSTNTNGFKIVDDYVNRTDGTYCATYKSNGTIKTLNSINGASFSIYKSGTNLVSGKEWYTYNYSNNKLYYFNQSKSYNVDEVLQKLSMRGDPYPVISLFAHWKGDGVDGGIDIGGASNSSTNVKAKSISLSGSSKVTKGKSTTLKVTYSPSNAKKETITWSSSNKKIASVNSSGKVTGISKGTVTITAKTSSGMIAHFKLNVVEETSHYVHILFHMNGGKLASSHTSSLSSSSSFIVRVNNSKIVQKVLYGSQTGVSGLPNYNNPTYLNIERDGYVAKEGAEWNTKKDGSGKSYSDKKVYKASDFCDASKKDCEIILYVNWQSLKDESKSLPYENTKSMIKEVMQAWYMRGSHRQYNSSKNQYIERHPEDSTSQEMGYSVCSGFTHDVLSETFGMSSDSDGKYDGVHFATGSSHYCQEAGNYIKKNNCNSSNNKCKGEYVIYYINNKIKAKYFYKNAQTFDDFVKNIQPGDLFAYTGHVLMAYDVGVNPSTGKKDVLLLNSVAGDVIRTKIDKDITPLSQLRFHSAIAPRNNIIDLDSSGSLMKSEGTIRFEWLSSDTHFVKNGKIICSSRHDECSVTRMYYKSGTSVKYNASVNNQSVLNSLLRTKLPGIYITKTVSASDNNSVYLNQNLVYTIKIHNASNMTNKNTKYPYFYVSEFLPTSMVDYRGPNGGDIEPSYNNGVVTWVVKGLKVGETITLKYKVTVKNNSNNIGKDILMVGKVYVNNSASITTGTVKNRVIKTPSKKINSYKACYNKYYKTSTGAKLIDDIYKCVYNKNYDFSKFVSNNYFDKMIVIGKDGVNFANKTSVVLSDKSPISTYNRMILNNYWNALVPINSGQSIQRVSGNGKSAYSLPKWRGDNHYSSSRATTIKSSDFIDGDVLIYKVDNTHIKDNSRHTYENGYYAFIYLDGKFIGRNGNGSSNRNEFTHHYYYINNLEIPSHLYSGNISSDYYSYFNYQTLFGKDYYVIFRPEIVI